MTFPDSDKVFNRSLAAAMVFGAIVLFVFIAYMGVAADAKYHQWQHRQLDAHAQSDSQSTKDSPER